MGLLKREQPLQARERPIRAAGSVEKRACGEPGSYDPGVEKLASGEWNGEIIRRYSMHCSGPCMPVADKAGIQITWNHFFFVGRNFQSSRSA